MPYGNLLKKDYIGEMAEVAGWGIYDISKNLFLFKRVKLSFSSL